MKYLIIGSRSAIATKLVEDLINNNNEILCLNRTKYSSNYNAKFLFGDFKDINWQMIKAWNPDICIDFAGISLVKDSKDLSRIESCINATEIVTKQIASLKNTLYIYVSSAAVYGESSFGKSSENDTLNPISDYGWYKKECESIVESTFGNSKNNFLILRPFSVYGPQLQKQVIFDNILKIYNLDSNLTLHVKPNIYRDFIHIDDVSRAIIQLIYNNSWKVNNIFNIGTGIQTEIRGLILQIRNLVNTKIELTFEDLDDDLNPSCLISDNALLKSQNIYPQIIIKDGLKSVCNYFLKKFF